LGQGDPLREAQLRAAVAEAAGTDFRVTYVHLPRAGVSRARSAALHLAGGKVLAFLDDDCEADPDWLTTIVGAFDADSRLGLVGGALVRPRRLRPMEVCPSVMPAEVTYDPIAARRHRPVGWDWYGANFAIRADVAVRVGAWDECLGGGAEFPAGEDTDYKFRAEALGIRMLTTPRSRVVHSFGIRFGRAALRAQRNYAFGNGALAAKLTLMGDPAGRGWLHETRRRCLTSWARRLRPQRLPIDVRHALWFELGYRRCMRGYVVDEAGLLRSRDPKLAASREHLVSETSVRAATGRW
jgi:glycosyltransferase involved in cell wall biosynthesis